MREIKVALGVTINTGNFESIRQDYSETAQVKPDEDIDEARERLYEQVDMFISQKIQEVRSEL